VRYVYNVPVPVERVIVFPMAVVPNLWGLWNILFIKLRERFHLSIGLFGALLPLLLAPLGIFLASLLELSAHSFPLRAFPVVAPLGLIIYYLAWKYLVASLNRVVALP